MQGPPEPDFEVLEPVAPRAQKSGAEVLSLDDQQKRLFLKGLAVIAVGAVAATALPKRASALVMGSTPGTGVVGVKDATNTRVNPATEEALELLREGMPVLKKTVTITSSGTIHTPAAGKKIRLYNNKFSLSASITSMSFRFTSGGTDFEIYLSPRTGGLYGTNNHPNYIEGGVNQALYCVMDGNASVQINIDYLEV